MLPLGHRGRHAASRWTSDVSGRVLPSFFWLLGRCTKRTKRASTCRFTRRLGRARSSCWPCRSSKSPTRLPTTGSLIWLKLKLKLKLDLFSNGIHQPTNSNYESRFIGQLTRHFFDHRFVDSFNFFSFLGTRKKNKFFFKLGRKAGRGTVDRIASFTIGPALLFWSMETFGLLVQIDAHRLDFCSFQSVRGHRHRFGHHQTAPAARPTAELGRAHRRRQPVRPYRVFFLGFLFGLVWFSIPYPRSVHLDRWHWPPRAFPWNLVLELETISAIRSFSLLVFFFGCSMQVLPEEQPEHGDAGAGRVGRRADAGEPRPVPAAQRRRSRRPADATGLCHLHSGADRFCLSRCSKSWWMENGL